MGFFIQQNYFTVKCSLPLQQQMKKIFLLLFIFLSKSFIAINAAAQCSLCTKTAMQMGEKPAQGLNSGILYLMLAPFLIVGIIGFRWWKNNKAVEGQEEIS